VSHSHSHHASPKRLTTPFLFGIGLNALFVGIEFFYGTVSHSVALIADAGHNLQDIISLILSALALYLATRPASPSRTYGFKKGTILAALIGSLLLVLTCGVIIFEAIRRFNHPVLPESSTMIWVALVGVFVNLGSALFFLGGKDHELNSRSAYLHLMADAFISLGVVATGLLIRQTGWIWLDSTVSIGIAIVILIGAIRLLMESLDQAIDGVPKHLKTADALQLLQTIPGVKDAHHLHIWAMSTTEVALTAHLKIDMDQSINLILKTANIALKEKLDITHITLQVEHSSDEDECASENEAHEHAHDHDHEHCEGEPE
jgi:cobalt-zinc-cadmium efflux system protein